MDRPDIYTDGERPERCANCGHANAIKLHTIHGVERTEYECGRRPEFVHRTQGARQVQLLGVAMSGWDELGREQDMAAARAVGYLEGMYDVAVVRKRVA